MHIWSPSEWTGSLNKSATDELHKHRRRNAAVKRLGYSIPHQLLRRFLSLNTFSHFLTFYIFVDFVACVGEFVLSLLMPGWLPGWTASGPPPIPDTKTLILDANGYLISAQVGVLGVISIAVGLVSLIAQREDSSTDVRLYYHESLAFEVVASSIALVAVLCIQLIWPMQFLLHRFGFGTSLQFFKLILLSIHLGWLIINLSAFSYFVKITFQFVQRSTRQLLRERYTANILFPIQMQRSVKSYLYSQASQEINLILSANKKKNDPAPMVSFGLSFTACEFDEIDTTSFNPVELYDVRMKWVKWVVQRWAKRSATFLPQTSTASTGTYLTQNSPMLVFDIGLGVPISDTIVWCKRNGGAKLNCLDKFVLKHSFIFRKVSYEE